MDNCGHCGAAIDPGAYECPYCKVPTRRAAELRSQQEQQAHARAQWEAQAQYAQQHVLRNQLASTAKQSLIWSLVGIVSCCTPFAIVGVVQGVRARGMATSLRAPVPGSATIGLVLSVLGCLSSIGLVTVALVQSHSDAEAASQRTSQLKKSLGAGASAGRLDHPTACALAEIYALESGFDGHPGYALNKFDCIGKLTNGQEGAQLETFRFRWSSTSYDVNACFKKGARWYVSELREASCPK